MADSSTSEYTAAGYYIARARDRNILSASDCLCHFFPVDWAIEWSSSHPDRRIEKAAAFGILSASLPEIIAWATASFTKTFGWPNAFYTLEDARQASATYLPAGADAIIFGLSLHESDVEDFLNAAKPPAAQPGFAPIGATGIYECVNKAPPASAGGRALGFELLATCCGLLTCSWLCSGLGTACADRLGIRPNNEGFIDNYADASRCADYISTHEAEAEPGLWLPWLITTYPSATREPSPSASSLNL